MGWKNVKEHYRIGHTVQVSKGLICIGSAYVHNLIEIRLNGTFAKKEERYANEDLARYQKEMLADIAKLKELIDTPDVFERSIAIWTYNEGDIIEKQCETPEWPNVTHDGQMIYENTFSVDRSEVVEWAKENALLWRDRYIECIEETNNRIVELQAELNKAQAAIDKLALL